MPGRRTRSLTTRKSSASVCGPVRHCGHRRCSSIAAGAWSRPARTDREWTVVTHQLAIIRQHDDALRRSAEHTRDAHAARDDAGVAVLRSRSDRCAAPARLPQVGTHTPVLSHDGADLAATPAPRRTRLRALPGRPGPRVHPHPQLGFRLGELRVLQDLPQLTDVVQPGVLPFPVRLQ